MAINHAKVIVTLVCFTYVFISVDVYFNSNIIFKPIQQSTSLPAPSHYSKLKQGVTCRPFKPLDNINVIKGNIPVWTYLKETTNPKSCKVQILNLHNQYQVCERIMVRIEARDWNNKPKIYGGDVFQGKIYSKTKTVSSSAAADYIKDFGNGTYLAYFTVRWPGKCKLEIKMLYPSEAIPIFRRTIAGKGLEYFRTGGTFVSQADKKVKETSICGLVPFEGKLCNFSDPVYTVPWYCQHPQNAKLTCADWKFHDKLKTNIHAKKMQSALAQTATEAKVVAWAKTLLTIPQNDITVFARNITESSFKMKLEAERKKLPFCTPRGTSLTYTPSGFFYRNKWLDDSCRVSSFSAQMIQKCLNKRTVYFLGDSTIRQLYTYVVKTTKAKETITDWPLEFHAEGKSFHLHFHFQGLPIGSGSALNTSHMDINVARFIDGLQGGPNIVVAICIWAHFPAFGSEFFINRLQGIYTALQNLLKRSPDTVIVIKNANTRKHGASAGSVTSNDWLNLQNDKNIRRIFHPIKQVGFINSWDLTRAQIFPDNVHPPEQIVQSYADIFLTYLCH